MSTVGYARVSSAGQKLGVQLEKLAHCDKVFSEKLSGVDRNRPKLAECLNYLREGDTLYVTKFDRIARSAAHLLEIVEGLKAKGVELVVIDQNLDTSTSTGRMMVTVMAAFAQFELEIRAERQADGIAKARQNGVKFGRKPKVTPAQVAELRQRRADGVLIKVLMKDYDLSKARVYQLLKVDPAHS